MNANVLFYCIDRAMKDESIDYIEIVGLKHTITLNPKKIINVESWQNSLMITKKISSGRQDQLLINVDQIVFLRIIYTEVKKDGE